MSVSLERRRLSVWATIAALFVLTLAACRPSGCDPDSDLPADPGSGGGGSGTTATGGGGGGGPEETIRYATFRAPEQAVTQGVVQYDLSQAGVFVLGGDRVLRRFALGSFTQQQALTEDGPDGGAVVPGKPGKPVALAAALRGDVVALGYSSGEVAIYDQTTLARRAAVTVKPPLFGVGLSGDGKRLVTLGTATVLWDVASGRELSRFEVAGLRSNQFPLVQLSHDGSRIAVVSLEREAADAGTKGNQSKSAGRSVIRLWDGAGSAKHSVPKSNNASDFALSQDGTRVVTGDYRDGYDLHDAASGAELAQVREIDMASLALSPDGATVAVGDTEGNLWLVDREAPDGFRKRIQRQGGQLNSLRYGAAGKWLYGLEGNRLQAIDTGKLSATK